MAALRTLRTMLARRQPLVLPPEDAPRRYLQADVGPGAKRPRTACDSPAPPSAPCRPCASAAPPPCRAAAKSARPALRVTCRPTPPHTPPRCEPVAPHRTCGDARTPAAVTDAQPVVDGVACGARPDRVAQRLAVAEAERRAQYERDAASGAPRPALPLAHYRLPAERECVRATDGRDYTVCGAPSPAHPSAPAHLLPADACEVRRGAPRIDPCAHRPRVILEIDRSAPRTADVPPATASKRKTSRERFTARIMESLNLKRDAGATCPRARCAPPAADWCSHPPRAAAAAPRCREPTVLERLRGRPGGAVGAKCGGGGEGGGGARGVHTATHQHQPCSEAGKGLAEVLRERAQHGEVARGRAVPAHGAARAARVHVSLTFVPPRDPAPDSTSCVVSPASPAAAATPWLAIRGIQRRWSGYLRSERR